MNTKLTKEKQKKPFKLGQRLLVTILSLVLGIVILAGASLWGLWQLKRTVQDVVDEYDELRLVEISLRYVTTARVSILTHSYGSKKALQDLEIANEQMLSFQTFQKHEYEPDSEHQNSEVMLIEELLSTMKTVVEQIKANIAEPTFENISKIDSYINSMTIDLLKLESEISVEEVRLSASNTVFITLSAISFLSLALIFGAVILSTRGFRIIMTPLRQLRDATQKIAAGEFLQQLSTTGDQEIDKLVQEFNQMGQELDSLYRTMEDKVASQSKELVRSERLASVGFLAAGVAHEINNPLNIISGYAELAQRWIDDVPNEADIKETRIALESIRSEAFRCKEIIEQLLSLSRTKERKQELLPIGKIAREVAQLAKALSGFRDRQFLLFCDLDDNVHITGNEVEIKQVLLNLVVNAMHATKPNEGAVEMRLASNKLHVIIEVKDNGCGIDLDSQPHVFEPFWSGSSPTREHSLGMGLSISHAIIEDHKGKLSVASDGKNQGAVFTITLRVHDKTDERS